ncbi:MAG TPA: hypothetical protein VHA75_21000 [Rugosimonospora sp.]|nr:hypothetical protein [Rugosimonospora sp.]
MRSTAKHLDTLPDLLNRLALATVPTSRPAGDFVTGGAFRSRPPVNQDALTLSTATAEQIRRAVQRPAPPASDAPIPLWVTAWAALWRLRLGHHQPEGVRRQSWNPGQPPTRPRPADAAVWAAELDERARWAQYGARVVLGLRVAGVPGDPDGLAEHWVARFGGAKPARRLVSDVAYLGTWLDEAAHPERGFADTAVFVVDLRELVAAGRRLLGEQSDRVLLGRCPEELPGGEVCGALLFAEPFVSRIVCPRCRAETEESGRLMLARRIREVWPEAVVDRNAWAG